MDDDFPAAPSTNTAWFAVDRDGRVGCFESGQSGAVPIAALRDEPLYGLLDRYADALPRSAVLQDRQGRVRPWGDDRRAHHPRGVVTSCPVLMFLKSLELVAGEIAAGRAWEVPSVSGFAVCLRELPAELAARVHAADVCLGCFPLHLPYPSPDREAESGTGLDSRTAAFGFYDYRHTCDYIICGPYGRVAVPAEPAHVDQLPPEVRTAAKALRFDLNFAETPFVQPVRDHECASRMARWLDLDGGERPMPGRAGDGGGG
jgi:hypothetical protein